MLFDTAFSLNIRKIIQFYGFLLRRHREWPEDRSLMGKSISLLCFREKFHFSLLPGVCSCLEVEKQVPAELQPKETPQHIWKVKLLSREMARDFGFLCRDLKVWNIKQIRDVQQVLQQRVRKHCIQPMIKYLFNALLSTKSLPVNLFMPLQRPCTSPIHH